jgi:tetratricopeptide (TPR) repeat protein
MLHALVALVRRRRTRVLRALTYWLALSLFVATPNASAQPATADDGTAEAFASAARTQLQSWDPEACTSFRRSIALQEKQLGRESLDVARSSMELAECLQRFNDREGAYRAAQQARASLEKLAPDSREFARALRLEGRLVDLFVDKPRARATLERALALTQELTGPNSLETAAALSALGNNRYGMNDLDGASRALVRAHEIQLAVHGAGHPDVALASAELAPLVAAVGQFESAEIMLGSALDVLVKAWGRHDPDVARIGLEYAEVEITLGKLARADKIATVVLGSKAAGQCSALRPIALIQRARISRLEGKLPPAVEFAKTAVSEFRG